MLSGDIDRKMVTAEHFGRKGNKVSGYGERWRVGLRSTQPNLRMLCHLGLTLMLREALVTLLESI